jgi:hypothetical protein
MAANRLAISRRLKPASTRIRVRAVAMNAEFPALLLAKMQILTMGLSALPLYLSGYTKGLDQTSSLLRGRRALQ